jgi:GT2 family glycosyltransferase
VKGSLRLDDVVVVVVTWNSAAHVQASVRSVPSGVRVVVVDNASTDRSAEAAREAGAEVIQNRKNRGFGPACNQGAAATGARAILFLNPDALLLDGQVSLLRLLAELESDPSVGAVAPALEGEGQSEFQLRALPTIGSFAREALLVNRLWKRNPWFLRERYLDRNRSEPFDVEQPAAAALLVRREAFDAIGGFDEAFLPAWFEDVDLAARLWKSGRRIRYVPSARAEHAGGTAMKALAYRDFLPLYTRNACLFLTRHVPVTGRVLSRLFLFAGSAVRLLILPFVKGDHERRDAAVAYLRVMSGLAGFGWKSQLLSTAQEEK